MMVHSTAYSNSSKVCQYLHENKRVGVNFASFSPLKMHYKVQYTKTSIDKGNNFLNTSTK
jgi:hypothetical protein